MLPPPQAQAPGDLAREHAEEIFGDLHEPPVVRVRHVELEQRELGIVLRGHSFVAKDARQLEDALDTTDDEALEIELGGDRR